MYHQLLRNIIKESTFRLHRELTEAAPFMAEQVIPWLKGLSGTAQPEDYFLHPMAFPMLLLPWWCEQACSPQPDVADVPFQTALAYSTINGYYYIRLIDNLMDGDAEANPRLLPTLNFFHTQFQMAYQPYFAADHAFWPFFKATWFRSGESAMQDALLTDLDLSQFKQIVAKKVCAAKIPVAAVCYYQQHLDVLGSWIYFIDLLGCWHQMTNDLFDWHKDLTHQTQTYFLAEVRRRKQPSASVAEWVVKEGFDWGCQLLGSWMAELHDLAERLESPPLTAYLQTRQAMFAQKEAEVKQGFQNIASLLAVFSK